MEKACEGIVSASAIDKTGADATSKISPRERRVTDKQEPRFYRKHGRVWTFGLTGNRGQKCRRQRTSRPGNPEGERARGSGAKKRLPNRVCPRARRRRARTRIRNCSSRSRFTRRARRWSSQRSRNLSL